MMSDFTLIKPAISKENAGKLIADELGIDRKREQAFAMAFTQTQSN